MNSGTSSTPDNDWGTQVVDTIESVVGAIRSKTSDPANRIAKMLVLGLMAAGIGTAALLMLTIGGVRVLINYLPLHHDAWLAYLILGMIFLLAGLFAWRKSHPAAAA